MRIRYHSWSISGLYGLIFACALFCLGTIDAQTYAIKHQGQEYIDLATVGSRLGMQAYWLRDYETFRLRSAWTNIDVGSGDRVLYINDLPVYLGFPVIKRSGRLYLSKSDHRQVISPILTPQVFPQRPQLKRIVLDVGHGGKDSGAENDRYGLKEKTVALDVAKRLRNLLQKAGYEVILTRETDIAVLLENRPKIANEAQADLFISIHFNAAENRLAAGYETFAMTPQYQASSKYTEPSSVDQERYPANDHDAWNILLAYHLQRGLVDRMGGPDRGVKRARWAVLKPLNCPGVLVELGFISHAESAQRIRDSRFRQILAYSLYDGILAYHKRLQRIR